MEIITRAAAGLPPRPSGLSRQTEPWDGITWHHTGGNPTTWYSIWHWQVVGRPVKQRLADIGYSYGFGLDGRVTELRGWDWRPAGDHENGRLQCVFMGNWNTKLPPLPALNAALEFAEWAQEKAGKPLPGIAHRDVWPPGHRYSTDCPGGALYAWVTKHLTTIGDTMADLDYSPRERPRAVGDRASATLLADLWGQEVLGGSPVDGDKSPRTEQLGRIETKLDELLARPAADVDEAALAELLRPHLPDGVDAAAIAAAVRPVVRAELDRTRLAGS